MGPGLGLGLRFRFLFVFARGLLLTVASRFPVPSLAICVPPCVKLDKGVLERLGRSALPAQGIAQFVLAICQQ